MKDYGKAPYGQPQQKGMWDSVVSGVGNYFAGDSTTGGGQGWGDIARAMLGGIAGSAEASTNRDSAQRTVEGVQENTRVDGDQDRRTVEFQHRLNEAARLNDRQRLSRSWDSWLTGGKPGAQGAVAPTFQEYDNSKPRKG